MARAAKTLPSVFTVTITCEKTVKDLTRWKTSCDIEISRGAARRLEQSAREALDPRFFRGEESISRVYTMSRDRREPGGVKVISALAGSGGSTFRVINRAANAALKKDLTGLYLRYLRVRGAVQSASRSYVETYTALSKAPNVVRLAAEILQTTDERLLKSVRTFPGIAEELEGVIRWTAVASLPAIG